MWLHWTGEFWCRRNPMSRFALEYWMDDGWYVGRFREVPGVFSQGATLEELEENVLDAYELTMQDEDEAIPHTGVQTKEVVVNL